MIRLLIHLPLVLVLVLVVVWALVLGLSARPEALLEGDLGRLAAAYPEAGEREALLAEALYRSRGLAALLPAPAGEERHSGMSPGLRVGLALSALHLAVLLRTLPGMGLLLGIAVLLGLAGRERLRECRGYASPTLGGLARMSVGGTLMYLAVFALAPVPISYGTLQGAGLLLGLGGGLFVANLPLKL